MRPGECGGDPLGLKPGEIEDDGNLTGGNQFGDLLLERARGEVVVVAFVERGQPAGGGGLFRVERFVLRGGGDWSSAGWRDEGCWSNGGARDSG